MHLNIVAIIVWVTQVLLFYWIFIPKLHFYWIFIPKSPKQFIYLPEWFYFSHPFHFLNLVANICTENYETPRYAILPASYYILCLRSRYYPFKNLLKNVDQALNLLGLPVENFDQNIGYTKNVSFSSFFPESNRIVLWAAPQRFPFTSCLFDILTCEAIYFQMSVQLLYRPK
jgi:hypothetical protein